MKKTIFIIFLCFVISPSAFAQENYKKLVDSLRYVTEVPFYHNCDDPILWKIIRKGKPIVPDLINKMTDTRKLKETFIPYFGGEYTVADVAYIAIEGIIADVPTVFDLLGVPNKEENDCGYCAHWYYVRKSKKNREKFQKAVRKWYEENKDNLVWVESRISPAGDCICPIGGHYILQKKGFEDYPPLRQLQCGLWKNNIGDIAYKGISKDENTDAGWVDCYITQIYKLPNDIFDEDNNPVDVWKNVVDTASFQELAPCHYRDKNYHYLFPRVCPTVPIECGRRFFYVDDKTFKKMQKKLEIDLQENPCNIIINQKVNSQ